MDQQLLYRPEEVARLLSISRSKVFAMIALGELPCVKIGKSIRVSREAIQKYVRGRIDGSLR